MLMGESVGYVIAAVDPGRFLVRQTTIADQMPRQLAELVAPAVGEVLVGHRPTPRERLGLRADLHGQCPSGVLCGSGAVVEEHTIFAGQLFGRHVAAVQSPDTV